MRVPALLLLTVSLALVASGCAGGPESPERIDEACERQIEQIEGAEEESATPTAKSTEERLSEVTLVECAGQQPEEVVSATEGEGEGEGSGEGKGETPAEEPAGEDGEAAAELDPAARTLFTDSCGSCHALSDAETSGAVGPNLDETELDAAGVEAKIAEGGGGMPPGLLQGEDATAVGEYVAAAAAAA